MTLSESAVAPPPAAPYRGFKPFQFEDRDLLFAREEETRHLLNLITVYRGVLVYGDSGSGKSSLINAALLPNAVARGFEPARVRVQPRSEAEIVVERVQCGPGPELLPSRFAARDAEPPIVLSTRSFEEELLTPSDRPCLVVFDQFEEVVTLFNGAVARDSQRALIATLIRLIAAPVPVKLVFVFREDYLGRVIGLFARCPELIDQSIRVTPPSADALPAIIRGPFERFPGHFAREISPELAETLVGALLARFEHDEITLTEIQTVCLRLWESDDPKRMLAERGPEGILEDDLDAAVSAMPPRLRPVAMAVLHELITVRGTRNVVSAQDLIERVRQSLDVDPKLVEATLEHLTASALVRTERRRDIELYELQSEYLIPWVARQRVEPQTGSRRLRDWLRRAGRLSRHP